MHSSKLTLSSAGHDGCNMQHLGRYFLAGDDEPAMQDWLAARVAPRRPLAAACARARVLRSLLTRAYWSRSCTVDPAYGWFLGKVKAAVDTARLAHGSETVRSAAGTTFGRQRMVLDISRLPSGPS